jgi:hypothetical protein
MMDDSFDTSSFVTAQSDEHSDDESIEGFEFEPILESLRGSVVEVGLTENDNGLNPEEQALVDNAILDAIIRDTIRGVYSCHPSITKGSRLDVKVKQMLWILYKNTRLYKGDFMGLQIAFNDALSKDVKQNAVINFIDACIRQLNSRNPVSINAFYKVNKSELLIGKSTFKAFVTKRRTNPLEILTIYRNKGLTKLLTSVD